MAHAVHDPQCHRQHLGFHRAGGAPSTTNRNQPGPLKQKLPVSDDPVRILLWVVVHAPRKIGGREKRGKMCRTTRQGFGFPVCVPVTGDGFNHAGIHQRRHWGPTREERGDRGPHRMNPKRELLDDVVEKVHGVLLGMARVDLEGPDARGIIDGRVPIAPRIYLNTLCLGASFPFHFKSGSTA